MARSRKLINSLTKYFILSTMLPFLLTIVLGVQMQQRHWTKQQLVLTDGYIDSLAENISMYINDIEQVIILPFFDDEVMSLLNRFSRQDNVSFTDQTVFNNRFGNLISSIRYVRNDFYASLIVHDNKMIYSNSNFNEAEPIEGYDWTKEDWYQMAIRAEGNVVFYPPHTTEYYDQKDGIKKISLVSTIRNLVTKKPYAVIKIDILPSSLATFFSDLDFGVPYIAYIADNNANLIAAASSESFMDNRLQTSDDNGYRKITGYDERLVNHIQHAINDTPYTLNILLDKTTMMMRTLRIYATGILLYAVAIIISMILNRRLTRRISEPITAMREILAEVEKGNFSVHYEGKKNWELEELGSSLNHTIKDLQELIEKNYVAELAKEKAENRALMSQIQPHFLFNTLNSLIALIYEGKYRELEDGLYNLSDLLRYVLRKDNLVSLREEIGFISSYLMLQKERFGTKLTYSIEKDERILETIVPRLILQPFVENSVIHGMEPKETPCHISIKVESMDSERIRMIISDDGAGFDSREKDYSSSIGISNSMNRIRILDPEASISIESMPDSGCVVTIIMRKDVYNESPDSR